jgi:predicted ATPase/class 3 adenylate cyclase
MSQSSGLDPAIEPQGETVGAGHPSGTVTLLFTDIEGSTRLWERSPMAMTSALKGHDNLLRSVIERSGGYVFKTAGDAFCAAFSTAKEAVQAASEAQRAISREPWPADAVVRVRMALHTGECEERDGDYFGPVLNRIARLESIAHGGQVVLTRATTDVVRDQLPEGVRLRGLGTHRLKDLGRPEDVFQLEIEGLEEDFPPLNSLNNPEFQHNLPEQVSSFVGREGEVAKLCSLLGDARIVTLTGPGGVGKTRLALQAAVELLDGSDHGVWFVDLAPIEDPAFVALTVANTLGIREERGRAIITSLVDALRERAMLVVLDNCEHVIEATATFAERLVQSCGKIALLATSREPLGIAGEHVYRVPSLSLPIEGEDDPDRLAESEAVRLFAVRAAQHKPGFALDPTNAPTIGRLCHRLDGIPLAIELAAARLRSMSLHDLEERLDQRFRILTGGLRTALPRQRTLQALIDWSYDLLSDPEQMVLDRLSVFAGGFDLGAAEAIVSDSRAAQSQPMDIIGALVDKSLVQVDEMSGPSVDLHYRLLETIRDYAGAKLAERGEADAAAARQAHRDHYLTIAETARPHLDGHNQIEWLDRLEREHDNLRTALSFCLTDPDPGPGLRLGAALAPFWDYRGYGVEGSDRLGAHLDRPEAKDSTLLRGRALIGAGLLLAVTGDDRAAAACAADALTIARTEGDSRLTAEGLRVFAVARYRQGEFGDALTLIEEGLALARALGDQHLTGYLLGMMGVALDEIGQDGSPAYSEALDLYHRAGNRIRASSVLNSIACREILAGDLGSAGAHLDEALVSARELGDRELVAFIMGNLGLVAYLQEEDGSARELFIQSLDVARRNGYQSQLGYALLGLALTSSRTGDPRQATLLHGFVDSLFGELGEQLQTLESGLRDADYGRLRSMLGVESFGAAHQAGRSLRPEEAISLARS